jgi:hypothetical protein
MSMTFSAPRTPLPEAGREQSAASGAIQNKPAARYVIRIPDTKSASGAAGGR